MSTTAAPQPASTYAFADDETAGATHHGSLVDVLAAILDPFTARRLAPHVADARCLEVAAGAGTIAAWMAERAAQVTATDTDIRHVATLAAQYPNLTARVHNLDTDPLEGGSYDLIHVRLLLAHLPRRHKLVGKLAAALAPGGVLVIDEFQASWDSCVLDAPDMAQAQRLFGAYHQALTSVLTNAGNDTTFGRNAHRAMRAHGLTDVDVEFWARSWHGGQAGCRLPYLAADQLRPKLLAAGMPEPDIDAFRELLCDPAVMIHGNFAVSTIGHKTR